MKTLSILFSFLFTLSCHKSDNIENQIKTIESHKKERYTIYIQPYKGFNVEDIDFVKTGIENKFNNIDNVFIKKTINISKNFYVKDRNRYRADSIIKSLKSSQKNVITLGLTDKDISASVRGVQDWGIRGYGYKPGSACVVSTYRMKMKNGTKREELLKVTLHELGHTMGLAHCPNKTCIMRDGKGGKNPLSIVDDFCDKCKVILTGEVYKKNN